MTGSARIVRGDALALPLDDSTVDLIVTSPPYFGLRSYRDGGEHYDGQIGDEATPAEFVDALVAATAEMVRVLKPSGSIFVNLGDKYAGAGRGNNRSTALNNTDGMMTARLQSSNGRQHLGLETAPAKSLMGIPWRYALRCIDDLGLILRAEVIWSKPNGLPESVTDRVRRSHETWFHFTREPRYFSAVDEIREGHTTTGRVSGKGSGQHLGSVMLAPQTQRDDQQYNPLGKLPGSVWTIDGGETLARSVLNAVAAQAITPDEGERILWSPSSHSWSGSQWSSPAAGNGSDTSTHAATARSASAAGESNSSTESPTSCTSDPSPTGSPSTTSAATPRASGQTTSSPSPSARTSDEPTPSASPAGTDTPWTTPTSTSPRQASATRNAGPASSPASDVGDSVWVVPTQPLKVPAHLGIDHFAAFPMEMPRRIIRGWSPSGVCVECGEGRRPVAEATGRIVASSGSALLGGDGEKYAGRNDSHAPVRTATGWSLPKSERVLTGYACACPDTTAPTTPGVVLDPFGGTGTTALVAKVLGRHGVSVDMSADYCRLATWRTTDPDQIARAMQVDKPARQVEGQADLFDLEETP